jgi:hypothetical protein
VQTQGWLMKIPEIFVAKVRDYLLNRHNTRLKAVLLTMIEEMEAEEIDKAALREMLDEIEDGKITGDFGV